MFSEPDTLWTKTYPGNLSKTVRETSDSGFIVTGGDMLIKTDFNGDSLWTKSFVESNERINAVQETSDGGYILTGYTGDISGSTNSYDALLIKIDSYGNEQWSEVFGDYGKDEGNDVQETSDGGYILTGPTDIYPYNVALIKTDSQGQEMWTQTFGGNNTDVGYSVQQTDDGGYIVGGYTQSFGAGNEDIWLIKTDSEGNEEWNQTYGGSDQEKCTNSDCVQQTTDGGYIITGWTYSYGYSSSDVWLVKTDVNGAILWDNTFGIANCEADHCNEGGYSVSQTIDEGYIIAGAYGENDDTSMGCLIKTNSEGQEEWTKTFGGQAGDKLRSVQQTNDGGYIASGGKGQTLCWLIRIESEDIEGCTNPDASNYDETANVDDGSCCIELWGECYNIEETTELNLSESGLVGEIPPGIGNLINLTYLNLDYNQLTGEIPAEIGNLTNLISLYLSNNQLTGEIPAEIGNLAQLRQLILRENQLVGEILLEIGNLINLEVLNIAYNQFTGEIPSEINNLQNLYSLNLTSNQFGGQIPTLSMNLSWLTLNDNQFLGELSDDFFSSFTHSLMYLRLQNNQLSGSIPQSLCDLYPGAPISDSWNVEHQFNISNNNFCQPYPDCMIDGNGSNGPDGAGYQDCVCNADEVELWGECYNIEETTELSLSNSGLTGGIPPEIGNLTNLTYLYLYSNQLTSLPESIGNLTNLQVLDIWGNSITEIPDAIENLTNLQVLSFFENNLSGEIPSSVGNLQSLSYLHLNDNQLTGEIPSEIGNLYNLIYLELQDNQFSGLIPENLCDINYVNIHDNNFCPPYPECLSEDDIGEQDTSDCPQGCTDSSACNYDPDMYLDDGSCEYNSGTWYVSTDGDNGNCGSEEYPFASIQYAIDSASDGDEVHVSAGTYYENIVWPQTNNITLLSIDGPEMTTINGSNNNESCIYIENSEIVMGNDDCANREINECGDGLCDYNSCDGEFEDCPSDCPILNAEINGFKITGGSGTQSNWLFRSGTGVLIDKFSNVTIENCDITENGSIGQGNTDTETRGAISVADYSILNLRYSKVHHNQATEAAGIWLRSMSNKITTIYRSIIYSNEAQYFDVDLHTQSTDTYFENSILYGEIYCSYPCIDTFSGINSIITGSIGNSWENNGLWDFEYTLGGCYTYWDEELDYHVTECGEGNINGNPQFTDPDNGDFTLQSTSPCIDAGDPSSPLDPDGTIADMGAYYFHQEQGDLNLDSNIDVLDILILVNCIIDGDCSSNSDLNEDGNNDILDIVTLVQIILD